MYTTLATLIDRLDSPPISETDVIRWSCPVPSFGDPSSSSVATLGLNPSNREFVDESGSELHGQSRRFHTLASLGLTSWAEADSRHLEAVIESCRSYFSVNPYSQWFDRLEALVSATNASYYDKSSQACHLDLIPYATRKKWSELNSKNRYDLLNAASDALARILKDSPIRLLILNGSSVVKHFQRIAETSLHRQEMPAWSLPRASGPDVSGFAFSGVVDEVSGIKLDFDLLILGYNHNLQSSYGVSTEIIGAIRSWIHQASVEVML